MSLQIWLPLTGDLHNQGLNNVTITETGIVSYDNAGKIGKCFISGGTSQVTNGINLNTNLIDILNSTAGSSIALWVKPVGNHYHYNGTFISSGNWNTTCWSFGVSQDNSKVDMLCKGYNTYISCTVPINTWTHLVCTFNNGTSKLYKNGVYIGEITNKPAFDSDASNTCIGRETYCNGYFGFNGRINDVRIYDHALSLKEIEELSKGLVLHYKLDQPYLSENILLNTHFDSRYAQTTGWDTTKNGTELATNWGGYNSGVANASTVYHAHLKQVNGEYVYEYIKDDNNVWLGIYQSIQTKITAGETYTFSWEQYCVSGDNYAQGGLYYFKTGATSANFHLGWYKGNVGRKLGKWQKFSYTFTAPTDGDYSKAMNWYIYGHFGGNGTFYVKSLKMEKSSIATPWCPAKTDKLYTALGYNSTTIYDSSGYSNNGTIVGNLTAAAGSPRYNVATVFNGTYSAIKVIDNNWCSQGMEAMTINVWVKSTDWPTNTRIFSCTESGGFNTEGGDSGYYRFPINVYTNAEKTSHAYKYDNQELQISSLSTTDWIMLTFVYDLTGTKTYINGELHHTYTNTSYGIYFNMNARLFLGCEANTANPSAPYFNGQQSDFRIYTTVLTAAQVKELYNTSTSIDSSGNIHARELVEIE